MSVIPRFSELARATSPRLDLIALALAQEFTEVDCERALAELDALGADVAGQLAGAGQRSTGRAAGGRAGPADAARTVSHTLGVRHGFIGDRSDYDHPDNSMLDRVLVRRRGLPILLSIVYVEVARRAGVTLSPIGLPGHFIVAQLQVSPPLLLDPFAGGAELPATAIAEPPLAWGAHAIAMRMLNNLVAAHARRGDLGAAIKAAELRTLLPAPAGERAHLRAALRSMQARLN